MPHCASSRQIISHWKNCSRQDCPVCLPLKQANDKRNQQGQQNQVPQSSPGPQMAPNQMINPMQVNMAPQPPQQQLQQQQPHLAQAPPGQIQPEDSSLRVPTLQGAYHHLGLQYPNSSGSPTPAGMGQPIMNGPAGAGPLRPNSALPNQPVVNSQSAAKEWHTTVTQDLRNHLIQKIVQAIFPAPDVNAYKDKRMGNLMAYAEKVERDMYETANSREEYYHLLAEKIYKIQKELEEKRQRRREQQMQQQQTGQPPPQNGPSPVPPLLQAPGNTGMGMRPMSNQQLVNCLNSNVPPNVTLTPNHPGAMGPQNNQQLNRGNQNQQFFVQPNSQAIRQPSNGNFGNITLSGLLGGPPSNSGNTNSNSNAVILNQMLQPQVTGQQPNTPQPTPLNSTTPTPPPPRPSSVPTGPNGTNNAANSSNMQTQQQLVSPQLPNLLGGNCGPSSNNSLSGGGGIKPEISASGQTEGMSSTNEDCFPKSFKDMLPLKTEPMEIEDFLSGAPKVKSEVGTREQLNVSQVEIKTEVKIEGKSEFVKKEEPNDAADSSQDVKPSIKEEPEEKPSTSVTLSNQGSQSSGTVRPTPVGRQKKVFNKNELRQALRPTLEKLFRQDPDSLPFRQPVDPQVLQIPDYFDIIKKPMDLSTIRTKLDTGEYADPWQYVDDVYLMFDNAWTYNNKKSRVYKYCSNLCNMFEQEIDPVMQQLGYCCGHRHAFQPQVLCCFGKQLCTIPRDAKYMNYQNR